ncbi:MAG: hydrogenase iron-sulfur subunit [Deltaproteobacteria bacterium]|nr:hydrogenase iron-sulfur subunit [Deltaproteobacteria bacterium]
MENKKLIVFICNWDAYHGLETAGAEQLSYDPRVIPIRLTCMGRISTGIILKAFEQGAMGVLLLGCPKDDCRYDSGIRFAEEVVLEAKKILNLLGYSENRLRLDHLKTGEGKAFTEKVSEFMRRLDKPTVSGKNGGKTK